MKNSIRILIIAIIFCSLAKASAQDSIPGLRKEFYISFAGFSPLNIGLRYKKQMRPKTYFKIALVSLSAGFTESNNNVNGSTFPVINESYSGGLEVGIEFRRPVTKKLTFFHGPSIRGLYEYRTTKNLNPALPPNQQKFESNNYTGAIPYSLGLLFQVYANFHAAVEIGPSIYGSYQKISGSGNAYNFNGGITFDNRYGLFSLVYRY